MQSLEDPTYGVVQELEDTLNILNPAYVEAITFLSNLHDENARITAGTPLTLQQTCCRSFFKTWQVLWQISHCEYHPLSLVKILVLVKSIEALLKSTSASPKDSLATVLDPKWENQPLCNTLDLNHLRYDLPLYQQLEELYSSTKGSIIYG